MKPPRFSLSFSILASLACLLILTWLLMSLISFKTAEQDLLAHKSDAGRILLASFISILPGTVGDLSKETAGAQMAARLAREPDFNGILLVDKTANAAYRLADGSAVDNLLRETVRTGAGSSVFSNDRRFVRIYAPILDNGRITGAARLSLSLASEYERLTRSRHLFLAYFVLDFLLLLGFGSFLLSRTVISPIKKMLAVTERIAAGDYNQTVHVPGSAEIADLAESFNTMVVALRTNRTEVEQTVASLKQANRDLQSAREETVRSEKMASVGLLAAGMAHEIGTPLAAIIGYVGILAEELENDPVKADYLQRIETEYTRIDRIVRGLLDYARPTEAHSELTDSVAIIQNTIELLSGQGVLKQIVTSFLPDHDLPLIFVDPHQLQQVLINLLINARDAMPDGGRLEVQVSVRFDERPFIMGRRKNDVFGGYSAATLKYVDALRWVTIAVSDSGAGIAPENLAKVFDPFFTTKEPGKGTGLGLAISARIIESFGGRITVESGQGGSTFIAWLPAVRG
jgi:signal transduction histidine kinase